MMKSCDCSAHNPSLHPNQFGGYHCLQLWPLQRWFEEEEHRFDQEAFWGGSFIRQGLLYIWITSIVQLKLMMLSLKVSRTRKVTDSRSRIVSKQAFFCSLYVLPEAELCMLQLHFLGHLTFVGRLSPTFSTRITFTLIKAQFALCFIYM